MFKIPMLSDRIIPQMFTFAHMNWTSNFLIALRGRAMGIAKVIPGVLICMAIGFLLVFVIEKIGQKKEDAAV